VCFVNKQENIDMELKDKSKDKKKIINDDESTLAGGYYQEYVPYIYSSDDGY
jgi:hypothetical protein